MRSADDRTFGSWRMARGVPGLRARPAARLVVLTTVALSLVLGAPRIGAQTIQMADEPGQSAATQIPALKNVGVDQKLDAQIPLDTPFVDEAGRDVKLGDYFGKRPVVLALVYYQCPMLCSLVLSSLVSALEPIPFTAGQQFEVVVVSFNPGETPALAAQSKATYVERYRRPGADAGFHFLTGRESSIHALTDAVGFRYQYDPAINQYAHPALVTVLTPAGRVSRYLLGIDYGARDLRLALIDAGQGHIGSVVDQTLLYCYHYDPASGRYSLAVMSLVRLGGVLTVAGVALSIWMTLRRDRRQANAVRHTATGTR